MKRYTYLLLITIINLTFGLTCPNQAHAVSTYVGEISLAGDSRQFELEYDPNAKHKIRWSIEQSGRHRLPLSQLEFDDANNTFSGVLSFIGHDVSGSIQGTIDDQSIKGVLNWQDNKINYSLKPANSTLSYTEENLAFYNGEIKISGTLILPKTSDHRYPAVIFVHGSGSATRWWGMYWASELSKIGVASLLYDKRGSGESTGHWVRSSLDDLSHDVVAGIEMLKKHPRINSENIGLYGVSQGGWITSRVSRLSDSMAFALVNSGGGVSPYDEEIFSYNTNMKFSGIDEVGRHAGIKMVEKYMAYLKTGEGRSELKEQMETHKNTAWFKVLGLDRIFVSPENRVNWAWVATYEPEQDISQMKQPIMLMFGSQDHQQPVAQSIKAWQSALDVAKNTNYLIKVYENTGHALVVGGHHAKGFPQYAENHIQDMKNWLQKNAVYPKKHRPK